MNPIIEIKDAVIGYGPHTVFDKFSLDIIKGEIVTFFGPSGCGKSTLIRAILGAITPVSGQITIKGVSPQDYDSPFAYVPQQNELFPWRTVLENLQLWENESNMKTKGQFSLSVMDALGLVQLKDATNKLPRQLSGGMERRTALARCLCTNSDIMILDEALISIETRLRRSILVALRNHIKEKGITCIGISHDLEEAIFLSDRIIVLGANPASIEKIVDLTRYKERNTGMFESNEFVEQIIKVIK